MTESEFVYQSWRHGGWYVVNVHHPSGAVGCVSRNYADRKWRIVCDPREGSYPGGANDHTYPNRDAAARAERDLIARHRAKCSPRSLAQTGRGSMESRPKARRPF